MILGCMRAAGPAAGGHSFELLLAGANDAVEEYTETASETLIEHDLQPSVLMAVNY
jgi:hypothetical protein